MKTQLLLLWAPEVQSFSSIAGCDTLLYLPQPPPTMFCYSLYCRNHQSQELLSFNDKNHSCHLFASYSLQRTAKNF
jgi:hypothetical protein